MTNVGTLPHLVYTANPVASLAPWPVRRDSVRGKVVFQPISKKAAATLWHKARKWDQDTRTRGRHGGIIGRTGLTVLYSLIFDFLNWKTGRLDPSLETIARKAGVSERTVSRVIAKLKALGLINWQRRCETAYSDAGNFLLRQISNAYAIISHSQWIGYRDNDPPPPDAATLGCPPPIPTPLEAVAAAIATATPIAAYSELMGDQTDRLAVALAQLGRLMGRI